MTGALLRLLILTIKVNNPGYSFIVELHLIKGHNLEKEKSGFTIFLYKANVLCLRE